MFDGKQFQEVCEVDIGTGAARLVLDVVALAYCLGRPCPFRLQYAYYFRSAAMARGSAFRSFLLRSMPVVDR